MFSLALTSFSLIAWNGVKLVDMGKPKSPEMQRFESALRSVLSVSKSEMKEMLADEKAANAGKPKRGPKPKTSVSGHGAT